MAKYQVLRRKAGQVKGEDNVLISGEFVEFVQIAEEDGLSQVQVYFVPEGKTDDEILGYSAQHHEDEYKAGRGTVLSNMSVTTAPVEIEPARDVQVERSAEGDIVAVSSKETK